VFDGTPNLEELRLEYNPVLENALIKELDWDSDLHALQFVDQKSPGLFCATNKCPPSRPSALFCFVLL
jgi:hypothetical protein